MTGSNGEYFASVSSGPVTIVANPSNANPAYTQETVFPTVESGQVYTQNFTLQLGGSLSGYITTGTGPLPNFPVTANMGGNQYGQGTTNTTGVFTIRNLSSGTYTVSPVVQVGQDSSPNSLEGTVVSTTTIFVGTFTITGSFGNIIGTVSKDGATVTSGALLLASTGTVGSTPPSIAASSAPALTPIYAISSRSDGSYVLPVRGNNTYYLTVYVPEMSNSGSVTVSTKTYADIIVSPSQNTTRNVVLP